MIHRECLTVKSSYNSTASSTPRSDNRCELWQMTQLDGIIEAVQTQPVYTYSRTVLYSLTKV